MIFARSTRRIVGGALLAFGLALLQSGCTYTQNRLRDLADPIHGGGGTGIGVSMRATHYLQTGIAFNGPRYRTDWLSSLTFNLGPEIGLGRGYEGIVGTSAEFGLSPLVHFRGNDTQSRNETRTIVLFRTLLNGEQDPTWQAWYDPKLWLFFPSPQTYQTNYDRRLFDIGLSLYLGIGIDFAVNPMELVDFVLGFFTIDISGDDVAPPSAESEVAAGPVSSPGGTAAR